MIFPTDLIFVITIVSILILIGSILSGYREGFILKGCLLVSTILCVMIAWFLSATLSDKLPLFGSNFEVFKIEAIDHSFYQIMNRFLLFIILFLLLRVLIILIRPFFKAINKVPLIGLINKILGASLGFIQALVILFVLVFIFNGPLFKNGNEVLEKSHLIVMKNFYKQFSFANDFSLFESLQKVVSKEEIMVEDDYMNVRSWLQEQGFSHEDQEEVISLLKQRNG